ncbi:MAG: hypothetical protein RL154_195, partial [Pseudomonadota bacterium]
MPRNKATSNSKLKSEINFHILENPFGDISKNEKQSLIDNIGNESTNDYNQALVRLQEIFKEYDPLVILSFLSCYGLTSAITRDGMKSYDRNIGQANVEICQALILQTEVDSLKCELPTPEIIQNTLECLETLLLSNQFKNKKSSILNLSNDEAYVEYVRDFVISHTQTVRNWGNFNQVKNIAKELYSQLDNILQAKYHFMTAQVVDFFNYIIKTIEDKNSNDFIFFQNLNKIKNTKGMIYKYCEFINSNNIEAEDLISYLDKNFDINHEKVLPLLYHHYTNCILSKNYIFNYSHIAKNLKIDEHVIFEIIEIFSYSFGDLKQAKIEH